MNFSFRSQENRLEDEQGKNEQLKEEADLLRRKAQLLDQVSVELHCRKICLAFCPLCEVDLNFIVFAIY